MCALPLTPEKDVLEVSEGNSAGCLLWFSEKTYHNVFYLSSTQAPPPLHPPSLPWIRKEGLFMNPCFEIERFILKIINSTPSERKRQETVMVRIRIKSCWHTASVLQAWGLARIQAWPVSALWLPLGTRNQRLWPGQDAAMNNGAT